MPARVLASTAKPPRVLTRRVVPPLRPFSAPPHPSLDPRSVVLAWIHEVSSSRSGVHGVHGASRLGAVPAPPVEPAAPSSPPCRPASSATPRLVRPLACGPPSVRRLSSPALPFQRPPPNPPQRAGAVPARESGALGGGRSCGGWLRTVAGVAGTGRRAWGPPRLARRRGSGAGGDAGAALSGRAVARAGGQERRRWDSKVGGCKVGGSWVQLRV
jgi:hypothetical protein